MARIVKKILPGYFDAIASGKKKYEFRVADFDIAEGDTLVLEEWDSEDRTTRKPTGRTIEKKVTYVRKFSPDTFKQKEDLEKYGFYILSIE
ncbi:hypothetical protein A3F55_02905 [Candidatus Adlerbacteria bacterium RIFCSPHIGHO2_12_FULL_53_18]|uniref:DUF3850 domain-containing protein n=2 Tax=Parcubacteria group TaxID=1794811 RepID=A0A1F4XV32_9BACT|nr:MAG: hypothetical protein A3F55_02905 [Candidatus Adlerbacteria bacterium RIFCSPHIGHO2_12_FULL_53_18]OGG49918.1 MAG: hypothetical protein A2704_00450 [Candidatus Kaiserbacteria bacterium RIFCSPHIGHO2_01_FULL_54_36b]